MVGGSSCLDQRRDRGALVIGRPSGSKSRCSACGGIGHNARGGSCSRASRAVMLTLYGVPQAVAADAIGLSVHTVRATMRRRRSAA